MTIETEDQLEKLRTVGRLVARTLAAMGEALEPGMTTKALDDYGRALLEKEGARSAPDGGGNGERRVTTSTSPCLFPGSNPGRGAQRSGSRPLG